MANAKTKKPEDAFEAYVAEVLKSYEITPEMRAAAHAQMKEQAARAAAAGVYQRIREYREEAVRQRRQSMVAEGPPRKKKK